MSETGLFFAAHPFGHYVVLVFSPSEASFRLLERHLGSLEGAELRWHSDTIEGLADIFMSHPALLVVFGNTNTETMDFIQLVRNNRNFRDLAIFAVLPEPMRLRHKMSKRNNIERFGTPLEGTQLFTKAQEILKGVSRQ